MITIDEFNKLPIGIIASGVISDSPTGINMMGTGKLLKYVVVKWNELNWGVYVHWSESSDDYVKDHGDLVTSKENYTKVFNTSDELIIKNYGY